MMTLWITFFLAFAFSLIAIPLVIRVSKKRNLFETTNDRRIHQRITPSRGGIAIFAGFAISLFILPFDIFFVKLGAILLVPFLTGLLDDHFHLSPSKKLFSQLVSASMICLVLNENLTSFYGMIDIELSPAFSFVLSVVTIVVITNAFNLIDGIDGLAGSVSSVILVFFTYWFSTTGDSIYSLVSIAILGAILAFLIFNWEPSKIFMGDTGSLVIGTLLSILTIHFINSNYRLPADSENKFFATVPAAIGILIIPLFDTIRVIIIRLRLGVSPLVADKRHIHHCLIQIGFSHRQAVCIIVGVQIMFLVAVLTLKTFSNLTVLSVVVTLAILLSFVLQKIHMRATITKLARQ